MAETFTFQDTRAGRVPPPSAERVNAVRMDVRNLDFLLKEGQERIFRYVLHRCNKVRMTHRERTTLNLCAFVEAELVTRRPATGQERARIEVAVMALVHDFAQTSTRYWGVSNRRKESYCTRCDRALPRSDFDDGSLTCAECVAKRQRHKRKR